ncbi:MAG: SurA N-terminal domain-containing protein [Pseudomonadota bacterium]
MLDFLRRGVKSWVAKILLLLLIASFAVWGIGDIFSFQRESSIASVGDTDISAQRFMDTMQRQRQLVSRQRGELVSFQTLRDADYDDLALNGLLRDAAFAEELRLREIAVSSDEVADAIRQNPTFQDGQGAFSQFIYQNRLSQEGYDPRMFEGLTRELLGQQILRDAVVSGTLAPTGMGEKIAAFRGEQRTITTFRLSPGAAPDPGTTDDAALEAYFATNSDDFIEPERRWGRYLHIDVAKISAENAPTYEEVRAEYDANIERYSVRPTRTVDQLVFDDEASARAALTRMIDGSATFEEIAAEQNVSLDDLALGTVGQEDLADATAEAVFALTEPGIAGPVETPFGFAVLNVTGVEIGGAAEFEVVREAIAASLTEIKARDLAPDAATTADDLRAEGQSLDEIAEATGHALIEFEGLAADGNLADGGRPSLAGSALFMREVLEALDAEERDVIELEDGGYAIVEIDRIVESHLPELDDIRDRVITAWQREQRLQALEARAAELVGADTGKTFDETAQEASATVQEQPAFARETPPRVLSPDLVTAIFDADLNGRVFGRAADGSGVLVAEVREITPLAEDQMVSTADQIGQALSLSMSRDTVEFFARAVEARHGTTVDEGAIEEVFRLLSQTGGHGGGY